MSVFVIVDIAIKNETEYKKYIDLITPSVKKYNGEYRVRGGGPETLDGEWKSERIVVMQYESRDIAKAWLNDPDLIALHDMRRNNSYYCNMIVCDVL